MSSSKLWIYLQTSKRACHHYQYSIVKSQPCHPDVTFSLFDRWWFITISLNIFKIVFNCQILKESMWWKWRRCENVLLLSKPFCDITLWPLSEIRAFHTLYSRDINQRLCGVLCWKSDIFIAEFWPAFRENPPVYEDWLIKFWLENN